MPQPNRLQKLLDRIFTPYSLIVLNLGIIFAAETVGHGRFFDESGLIHGIAILFIILASARVFKKYYLFDPEVKLFLRMTLVAMGFFALSHFVEFATYLIAGKYTDAGFADVINFYLMSLVFLFIGTEQVFVAYEKRSNGRILAGYFAIAMLATMTVLFVAKPDMISLEIANSAAYAYAVAVLAVGIYGILRMRKIGKLYPWFNPFVGYMVQAITLIMAAALVNVFYDVFQAFGVDDYQVIYLSHFTFYAALSVMFLAYGDPLKIGGMHKDIREAMESGEFKSAP